MAFLLVRTYYKKINVYKSLQGRGKRFYFVVALRITHNAHDQQYNQKNISVLNNYLMKEYNLSFRLVILLRNPSKGSCLICKNIDDMNKGQVADAQRKALNEFDKWNEVSGAIQVGSSWYWEIQSIIEDCVHIGIQMTINGKVDYDKDGNVLKSST